MQLYAKILGESQSETILFLPGMTGSHASWNQDFLSLSRQYRLVLIDMLGFGHSPKPEIGYTLDDHLNAVRDTLQTLGVERVQIVAHSMGTLLGLAFAARFPTQVMKLALLALPWFQNEQAARKHLSHSSLFHRFLAMDTPLAHVICLLMCALRPLLLPVMPLLVRDVPSLAAEDALRHTWSSYSRTLRQVLFRAATTEWMRDTTQPLLLLHGRQDTTAPLSLVQAQLASLHRSGPVELIELDADHELIFTHSQVLVTQIAAFFQRGAKPIEK
jgi:pimeloyl-ACP methyl ester carboxylesterase